MKNKSADEIVINAFKKATKIFLDEISKSRITIINPEPSKKGKEYQKKQDNFLKKCPKTLDEAVNILFKEFKKRNKKRELKFIKSFKNGYAFAIAVHREHGMRIRNDFGMWIPNEPLLKSCDTSHPDDASTKIHEKLWDKIIKEM